MIDAMRRAEKAAGNTYFNMAEYRAFVSRYIHQLGSEIGDARRKTLFSQGGLVNPAQQMVRAANMQFFEMMDEFLPVMEARFDDLTTLDEEIVGFYAGKDKPKENLYLVRNVVRVVMPRFVQGIEQVAHQNYMAVLSHALGKNADPSKSMELHTFAKAQTEAFKARESLILDIFLQQAVQAIWMESEFNDMIESSVRDVRVSLN
jgi:hypothetical protein